MTGHINTFLLDHGCKIKNLTEYDASMFISIRDELKVKNYFNSDRFSDMYVSGYIDFVFENHIILSWKQWDLIDQLWAYIINGIREAVLNKEASFYFPDQPLLVKLQIVRDRSFLLFIDKKKYFLSYDVLLTFILPEAEFFFYTFLKYKANGTYSEIVENIIPECRKLLK
jgi:hypothetical protein